MPVKVDSVPNLWAPYLKGIWKFTNTEFLAMPKWIPTLDPQSGEIVGTRQYTTLVGTDVYVQFSDKNVDDWNKFWGFV